MTAFVDGSNIYGSDVETSEKLRSGVDGLLKINSDFITENLPTRAHCGFPIPPDATDQVAGDVRAIVQPALTSIHTLFLNEHNRIARELKSRLGNALTGFSSSETDEFLFQETRKIVGAELQKVVYQEYLPVVLGADAIQLHGLALQPESLYNPEIDPSILNEFATVAYRFGHSTVRNIINGWPLGSHFFNFHSTPEVFVVGNDGNNWKNEMTGAISELSQRNDLVIGDVLRNRLFGSATTPPEDLAARNIQRAREHGIPEYNVLRQACNLSAISSITDEPFTAGLAEEAPNDGILGPLFSCIVGMQFQRLKDGDRYFFTHTNANQGRGLGENTKHAVLKRTLGHIICDNTETTEVQRNVFKESSTVNPKENCESINKLDFECIVKDLIGT